MARFTNNSAFRFRVQVDGVEVSHLLTGFEIHREDHRLSFRLEGDMPETELAPDPLGWRSAQAVTDAARRVAGLSDASFTVTYDQMGEVADRLANDFLRRANVGGPLTPHPPMPEPTHAFDQDPAEEPAQLCVECGYWPEHHNHGGCRCHCQDCVPDASMMDDYSSYDNGDIDDHEHEIRMAGRDARFAALDGAVQDEIERQRQEEVRRRWAALAPREQAARLDGDDWRAIPDAVLAEHAARLERFAEQTRQQQLNEHLRRDRERLAAEMQQQNRDGLMRLAARGDTRVEIHDPPTEADRAI